MNKQTLIYVAVGILIGVVLQPQIAKLPLVNKIPQL